MGTSIALRIKNHEKFDPSKCIRQGWVSLSDALGRVELLQMNIAACIQILKELRLKFPIFEKKTPEKVREKSRKNQGKIREKSMVILGEVGKVLSRAVF